MRRSQVSCEARYIATARLACGRSDSSAFRRAGMDRRRRPQRSDVIILRGSGKLSAAEVREQAERSAAAFHLPGQGDNRGSTPKSIAGGRHVILGKRIERNIHLLVVAQRMMGRGRLPRVRRRETHSVPGRCHISQRGIHAFLLAPGFGEKHRS